MAFSEERFNLTFAGRDMLTTDRQRRVIGKDTQDRVEIAIIDSDEI